jgi:hypothetical protein
MKISTPENYLPMAYGIAIYFLKQAIIICPLPYAMAPLGMW